MPNEMRFILLVACLVLTSLSLADSQTPGFGNYASSPAVSQGLTEGSSQLRSLGIEMRIQSHDLLSGEAGLSIELPVRFLPDRNELPALATSIHRLPVVQSGVLRIKKASRMEVAYPIDDAISALEKLSNVVSIQGLYSIRSVEEFRKLLSPHVNTIQQLQLGGAQIDDAAIELLQSMPHLTSLDLSDIDISDSCVASLSSVRTLRSVSLGGCRGLSDKGIADLIEHLPNLRAIYLHDTTAAEFTAKAIANHRRLKVADLGWCEIKLEDLQMLLLRSSLAELHLPFVDLGDLDFSSEDITPTLTLVHVSRNGLSGATIEQLKKHGVKVFDTTTLTELTSEETTDGNSSPSGTATRRINDFRFGPFPLQISPKPVNESAPDADSGGDGG